MLNVLMGSSRSEIRQQRDYRLFWKATLIVTLTILTFHALQHFHMTVVFLPTCLILIQQLGKVFILALTLLAERAFSPNGDILALGYLEGCLRIWNMLDGKSPVLHYDLGMITSVTFSSDGEYLAAATVRNTAWIWDLSSGKQYNFVEFPSWVVTMAFLPNGHLLTKTGDGAIRLWDPTAEVLDDMRKASTREMFAALAFSPSGDLLESGTGRFWNPATGRISTVLDAASGYDLAFSPDGHTLALKSRYDTIQLWDMVTRTVSHVLYVPSHPSCGTFSPDGKYFACGLDDGTLRLWEMARLEAYSTLRVVDQKELFHEVAFSPDNKLLACKRCDGVIVFDISSQKQLKRFPSSVIAFDVSNQMQKRFRMCELTELSFGQYDNKLCVVLQHTHSWYFWWKYDRIFLPVPHPLPSSPNLSPPRPLLSLDYRKEWITWNNHNLLFLPPDYRPVDIAVHRSVIAMRDVTNLARFLHFDPSRFPEEFSSRNPDDYERYYVLCGKEE